MTLAINCPHCDHDHCTTLRTGHHTSGVIMRSRKCSHCKQHFPTYQLPGESHQTVGYLPNQYKVSRKNPLLTYELATVIRTRVSNGENQIELANELGLHRSTVGKIVRNVVWTEEKVKRKEETKSYKLSRCCISECVHWERKCTMGFTELDGYDCACYAKKEEQ